MRPSCARLLALVLSAAALGAAACSGADVDNPEPGKTAPGVGEDRAERSGASSPAAGWLEYRDEGYGFRLYRPPGFVVRPKELDGSAKFVPAPVSWILFMNPTMAQGDLAGIEPADLALRVFEAPDVDSLADWLERVGLAGRDSSEPYERGVTAGIEVCHATLLAPGCSVYFLASGRVYQLTPASRKGEAMVETFVLSP